MSKIPAWRTRNQVLEYPDFYISYADTSTLGVFAGDSASGIETALRHKDGRDGWSVLNGDYRKQYEKLAAEGGYEACKRFYDQQSAHAESAWSTNGDTARLLRVRLSDA